MRKKILLIASIVAFSFTAKAQTTEQVLSNFKSLVAEAATDFKNVKGALILDDSATNTFYYDCDKNLGSAIEAICIDKGDGATYHTTRFEFNKTAELLKANEVLSGIIDEVNVMVKSGKYTGRDYKKSEIVNVTEVKDLDGNYIIEIESRTDPVNNDNDYLSIVIYGKSWGKK